MAAVDEIEGAIRSSAVRRYSDVRRGYTPFRNGDVLFAKITPCMENGKAAVARDLVNGIGFGSTEFHVIRAGPRVLPQWLYFAVRREDFRRAAKRNFTGTAGQQRVPTTFVAGAPIPLPPLPEQRRIVDILSRAEAIIRLRREAQKKAQELIPALFLDMFGDPATNPKGWPIGTLGTLGTLDRGRSRNRPRDAKELYGGPYPFIQTGDVANGGGRITKFEATYSETGLAQSRLWPKGTLCITIAANIAKTGVLEFDACFPDSVVGFLPSERVRTAYVQAWLAFLQPMLEATAPQAAQKNINLEILRNLPVPVAPIRLQERFQQHCTAVASILANQTIAITHGDSCLRGLLAGAFDSN